MKIFKGIIAFSINRPKIIIGIVALIALLALIQFPKVKIDTDPENMLSEKAFVRIFHDSTKKEFALFDYIILGIVNEKNSNGVFNPDTLRKIYNITEEIKNIDGVIAREIIAPSTKDNIRQAGLGSVVFEWLMPEPPYT